MAGRDAPRVALVRVPSSPSGANARDAIKALPMLEEAVRVLSSRQVRLAARFRCEGSADLVAWRIAAVKSAVAQWTIDCGMEDCAEVEKVAGDVKRERGGNIAVRVRRLEEVEADIVPRTNVLKIRETLMLECGIDTSSPCVPCPSCYAGSEDVCGVRQAPHKNRGRIAMKQAHLYSCPGGPDFTWPMPDEGRMERLYQNYNGQARGLSLNHPRPVNQKAFIDTHMTSGIKLRSILEIGCAGGFLLGQFKSIPGLRMTCVEGDADQEKTARKTLEGMNFVLQREMIESSTALSNTDRFDLIMSSHVIEHVPDPCGLFKQLHKMLKPGGYMFHEIPCETVFNQKGQLHMTFWTANSIRSMVEQAGFNVVGMSYVNLKTFHSVGRTISADDGNKTGNVRVIAQRV